MNSEDPAVYPLPPGVAAQEGDFVKMASDNFNSLVVQDTRVYKAGNSLVIRIPSAVAKHCDLKDGSPVQMAADNGMIYVRKAPSRELGALLERITPDNVHGLLFDEPVGNERW
jgi:antitoxin component of MazEF toxin-antitoxin module